MSPGRLNWIDRARGVGIVLVVLGHNPIFKDWPVSVIHDVIFLFHMPLFFYLAGLVQKEVSISVYVHTRARALLVPYLVSGILFSLIAAKLDWERFVEGVTGVLVGIGDLMPQPHIWFLPCLFLVGLMQTMLLPRVDRARTGSLLLILIGLAALSHVAVSGLPGMIVAVDDISYLALPWSADLVPVGMLFFLIGIVVRRRSLRVLQEFERTPLKVLVCFGLIFVSACWVASGGLMKLDLNHRVIQGLGVLPLAVAFVIGISAVCVLMPDGLGAMFEYLGRSSLVIFIFHYFIQSRIASRLGGLDGAMIGFAFGLIVPLAFDFVIRRYPVLRWIFYPGSPSRVAEGSKP
jgi:fucose 4-O-acetylase-like acetyltransferase